MAEPMYPIYLVSAKWIGEGGADSTSFYRMLRERDDETARVEADKWWERCKEKHDFPGQVEIVTTYKFDESWCSGWFSHWTFDIGQPDAEVLASFRRYVNRMLARIDRESKWVEYTTEDGKKHGYLSSPYSLMGAEDEWRWTARAGGTSMIGCGEQTGDPPCRCSGCKEQGILRIDH